MRNRSKMMVNIIQRCRMWQDDGAGSEMFIRMMKFGHVKCSERALIFDNTKYHTSDRANKILTGKYYEIIKDLKEAIVRYLRTKIFNPNLFMHRYTTLKWQVIISDTKQKHTIQEKK